MESWLLLSKYGLELIDKKMMKFRISTTAIGIPARVLKRGYDKTPLSHNKIPDVNKEIFEYLLKRIEVLEGALPKGKQECVKEKDHKLEELYDNFIHSMD